MLVREEAFSAGSSTSSDNEKQHDDIAGCFTLRGLPERTMTLAASLAG